MKRLLILSVTLLCLISASRIEGQPVALPPTSVPFPAGEISLDDVVRALKQTGNDLADRRAFAEKRKLTLPFLQGDFWPTLDAIGQKTGIGFSAYQPDGGVALVDRPYRPLPTSYASVFRFAVKRVAVLRDDETQTRLCTVTLDVAWEPRFQPFFLNLQQAEARFAPAATGQVVKDSIPRQTRALVTGTCAAEIELRMKAPARSSPTLASLTGSVEVVGPPRMLEFTFEKIGPINRGEKPRTLEQDGVQLSVTYADPSVSRWTVDLELVYPPDSFVRLESFQEANPPWRANNRVWLSWLDPRTGKVRTLEKSSQSAPTATRIRYLFEGDDATPLPPRGANVSLNYRTPNRVVAFSVPFSFRDLPLP